MRRLPPLSNVLLLCHATTRNTLCSAHLAVGAAFCLRRQPCARPSPDSVLNRPDKASLDLAALHVAQKIQEAKLTEEPNVLVIDFFRSSAGNSSQLGTLLADYLADSLSNFSRVSSSGSQ